MPEPLARGLPAKVSKPVFLGFLWTGTAVSLCLLIFRLSVNIRTFRKLHIDDFLVILAWSMLFGSATFWQVEAPEMYYRYEVLSGQRPRGPEFLEKILSFTITLVPFNVLFFSCLWTTKISFLFFFRRLQVNVKGHKIWWWCVLLVVMATWVGCIALIYYKCSLGHPQFILGYCRTPAAARRFDHIFISSAVLDIITDCLIITIPIALLWNAKMTRRQKILLMVIFSLSLVVMVIAVIRVALVNSSQHLPDITWLFFWSNLEMTTSIIIACIVSFRQVFVTRNRQRTDVSFSHPGRTSFSIFNSSRRSSGKKVRPTERSSVRPRARDMSDEWDSHSQIIPLNSIRVGHSISISHEPVPDHDIERIAPFISMRTITTGTV